MELDGTQSGWMSNTTGQREKNVPLSEGFDGTHALSAFTCQKSSTLKTQAVFTNLLITGSGELALSTFVAKPVFLSAWINNLRRLIITQ